MRPAGPRRDERQQRVAQPVPHRRVQRPAVDPLGLEDRAALGERHAPGGAQGRGATLDLPARAPRDRRARRARRRRRTARRSASPQPSTPSRVDEPQRGSRRPAGAPRGSPASAARRRTSSPSRDGAGLDRRAGRRCSRRPRRPPGRRAPPPPWPARREDTVPVGPCPVSATTPCSRPSAAPCRRGPTGCTSSSGTGSACSRALDGGAVDMWSRNGLDSTGRFPAVAAALPQGLGGRDAVVDGEVCALDERGRPELPAAAARRGHARVLRLRPARAGRRAAAGAAAGRSATSSWRASSAGRASCASRAPSTTARRCSPRPPSSGWRASSPSAPTRVYRPGVRTRDWVKVKVRATDVLAIAGWTHGQGARARFGALVLAARDGDDLVYAGNVGTGFNDAEIDRLLERLRPLERPTSPLVAPDPQRAGAAGQRHLGRAEAARAHRDGRVDERRPRALAGVQGPGRCAGAGRAGPEAALRHEFRPSR